MFNCIIVGAGPAGLACAIEAEKKGLNYRVLDKGCIVNSVYHFPADMEFFSTPDLLAIGDLAFITTEFRPNRIQALQYYLAVVKHYGLKVMQYTEVEEITREGDAFTLKTVKHGVHPETFQAEKVVIATGYYDNPNLLGVEGEELEKVSHYYTEAHPCFDQDVLIIGGKNSAVEAALSFSHTGARVTLAHRGPSLSDNVKHWVRPVIEKRIESGRVNALFNTTIKKITPETVVLNVDGEEREIKNDKVFALTGYHPDPALLEKAGVKFDPESYEPDHNPANLETNVPGLHVAGSIAAGKNCNRIFIENSREHGKIIFGQAG